MDKKVYASPETDVLTITIERCILSLQPNQGRSQVEDANAVDGTW